MGLRDSLKVDPCEYLTISATGAPLSAVLARSQKKKKMFYKGIVIKIALNN